MNRKIIILGIFALAISIFGLFQVKYKVYNLKHDLADINAQLASDKEAIRVLKAEWAYLNKPERIEKLANKYLGLQNIQVAQINKNDRIDASYFAANDTNDSKTSSASVTPVLKPILSTARSYR